MEFFVRRWLALRCFLGTLSSHSGVFRTKSPKKMFDIDLGLGDIPGRTESDAETKRVE
jgi:hypothetical protein